MNAFLYNLQFFFACLFGNDKHVPHRTPRRH